MDVRVIDGSRTHVADAARIWAEATAARDQEEVAPLQFATPIIQGVLDRSPRSLLLVAVVGDAALGFAAVEPVDSSTAEVSYVGVHPDAWGSGVGTSLVKELPSQLSARGFTHAQLMVYVDNHRAVRLYESAGWRAVGRPAPHPRSGKPEQQYVLSLTG
ncbi:GNAT family N-acetyltransferase [Saccharopolyspora sp. NPDC002376]